VPDTESKVAILGAGAVGGLLGVLLARAGHQVTMLARDRTAAAITVAGLTLRSGQFGELQQPVEARPWLVEPVDVLFVTVKAPDLLPALSRAPASLVTGAAVVPLLNGVDHVPLLRAALPASRVVPMTVAVEATRIAPGVVEHRSSFADFAVAAGAGRGPHDPAEMLREAGLDVDHGAPDETTLLWRKLAFLAPFALITTGQRAPIGAAREARPDVLDALLAEAAAAGAAAGASLDPGALAHRIRNLPASMQSSMLTDARSGAALELDAIAGPVIRHHPGGAPVTRAVVADILAAPAAVT
jgi:2-dehydropantoate 2-reductase